MLQSSALVCLMLTVAMVTAAPLGEQIASLDQAAGEPVKRAEEEIYFGNQQNEARGVAKKSGGGASGQVDAGGMVTSHQEVPVEEDLARRAEEAKGRSLRQDLNDAYEFAMHQAVQNVLEEVKDKAASSATGSESPDHAHSDDVSGTTPEPEIGDGKTGSSDEQTEDGKSLSVEASQEVDAGESAVGSSEAAMSGETAADAGTDDGSDGASADAANADAASADVASADAKSSDVSSQVVPAAGDAAVPAGDDAVPDTAAAATADDAVVDTSDVTHGGEPEAADPVEAARFQQEEKMAELPYPVEYREENLPPLQQSGQLGMPRFLSQLKNQYQGYDVAPQWRPLAAPYYAFQQPTPVRRRRIKRDLLDDEFGVPYERYARYAGYAEDPSDYARYVPEPSEYARYAPELSDYAPELSDYARYAPDLSKYARYAPEEPVSDEDIDYVYRLFLAYLEQKAEEEIKEERDREILRELPSWATGVEEEEGGAESDFPYSEDSSYLPEEERAGDEEATPDYEDAAGYGSQDDDVRESGQVEAAPVSKRFLAALTGGEGWGEFKPEKRDYSQAVQRLQRLALALSDNQGGYYRDMMEDYKKR